MSNHSHPLKLRIFSASDPGLRRELNEDSVLAEFPVFVVADGMGGHSAGDVASNMVVEGLRPLVGQNGLNADEVQNHLLAIQDSVTRLADQSDSGAGSTVSGAVAIRDSEGTATWLIMNLGDSRTYRMLGDTIVRATKDHSIVQELIDEGTLSESELDSHPQKNVITRAFGDGESSPDLWVSPMVPGERLLIVSDGVLDGVTDRDLGDLLAEIPNGVEATKTLVELALLNGGKDNISVVLVDVIGHQDAFVLPPLIPVGASEGSQEIMEAIDDVTAPGLRRSTTSVQ